MNSAANLKLPVLFVCEDNEYAISVPVEVNTAGGNISKLVANFPNFYFAEIDGTDPVASYAAMAKAVEHCRSGKGPAFVHGHVIRPYSHSLSDDEKLYRPDSERQKDAQRDPITRMQMFLIREGILDEKAINALEKSVDDEIQLFDYLWPAWQQLRTELSNIRWRSDGNFSSPAVIRVAIGGYLTGGAVYHSQCGESIFTHTPGIRVVFPSNALDANGLLRTSIRCDDPVLFLEHKPLYRETFGRAPYPGPDFMVPFGKARTWKEGTDISVITYGAVVPRALQAAQRIEREQGVSVELIDLRTLNPYDWEAIVNSVKKTNRVIVAHEDTLSWGYGAEIAARIADELFEDLDAPAKRGAAMDTFVAYQPALEDVILPQAEHLFKAMEDLAKC